MAEVLRVERLVPEVQSAEEPSGRPGTGQLGIPVARSAAGTSCLTGLGKPCEARLSKVRVEAIVGRVVYSELSQNPMVSFCKASASRPTTHSSCSIFFPSDTAA